jgi:cell division protein FtsZ
MDIFKFEIQDEARPGARIKVIGVGGGGSNAVDRMFESGLEGVEFYVMNTDRQALEASRVPNKIQIGAKITNGLGAGSNPEIGRRAALEDTERILGILEGADLVFVTAGLGGGTGAGAAPVVASLAKSLDALTIAIVTTPFAFEGVKRMAQATNSVSDLAESADILTTIPNERLIQVGPQGIGMKQAFRMADEVLRQAVEGISEIILTPGLINLDFSDIRAAISGMGHALIGNATATGEDAAVEAASAAINSPLLEDTKIRGARQVLLNLVSTREIGLHEMNRACSLIRDACGSGETHVSFGVIEKPGMGDSVRVTVIATGFPAEQPAEPPVFEHEFAVGSEPAIVALPVEDFFAPREAFASGALTTALASATQESLIAQPAAGEPEFAEPEPMLAMAAAAMGGMPMAQASHNSAASAGLMSPASPGHTFDDELDVPAYLRQGKLLS